MASCTAPWSVVGATWMVALPLKLMRPTPHVLAEPLDELVGRLLGGLDAVGVDVGGLHRQRGVDGEDERGPRGAASVAGRVGPERRRARPCDSRNSAATTWRRQPGRFGATESSSSRLVKRTRVGRAAPPLQDQVEDGQARPRRTAARASGVPGTRGRGSPVGRPGGHAAALACGDRRSGRCRAASRGRCAGRGGRRRRRGCAGRCPRAARRPPRRSARAASADGLDLALRRRSRGRRASITPDVGQARARGGRRSRRRGPRGGRPGPAARAPSPSGARKSETTTTRPAPAMARPGPGSRWRPPGRRCPLRSLRRGLGGGVQRAQQMATAGARREDPHARRRRRRRRPSRLPVRRVRKPMAAVAARARSRFSQLAVPKSRLAERSSEHPGRQLAVGDRLADVDLGHAGGDVPVDAADVVAGLVDAGVARLAAVARGRGPGSRRAACRRGDG